MIRLTKKFPFVRRVHKGRVFANTTVHLDRADYINCTMTNCQLVYSGGDLKLIGNDMNSSKFVLDGAAGQTLVWLRYLHAMVPGIIDRTFGAPDNLLREIDMQVVEPQSLSVH